MEISQFKTVEQLASANPAFSKSSLRWMMFNRASNGLDAAVIQIGRKVLIDEQAFVAWLDQRRGNALADSHKKAA